MFPDQTPTDFSADDLFDFCPNPLWIYDVETLKFLKVNREAVRHYGYGEKEFLTLTLADISPVEDLTKLSAAMELIDRRDSESFKEGFYRHLKKDGTVFPVQLRGNLVTYDGRKAELVMATDISETIASEKRLLFQKRIFQAISEINTHLIRNSNWMEALEGCFTIICTALQVHRAYFYQSDPADATITLKAYRSLEGMDMGDEALQGQHLPYPLLQQILGPVRKGRKYEQSIENLEDVVLRELFTGRNLKSILVLPIFVNNRFRGVIGLEDLVKTRKWHSAEKQLLDSLVSNLSHLIAQTDAIENIRANEKRFRNLVQKGTDLIAIIDSEGRYKYTSPTYSNQLAYDKDTLLGQHFTTIVCPEHQGVLLETLQRAKRETHVETGPYRVRHAKGTWRWMETKFTNHLKEPTIEGLVANTSDVTQQVHLKRKRELALDLTKTLANAKNLKVGLRRTLKKLVLASNVTLGEIWLRSKDGDQLTRASYFHHGKKGQLFLQKSTLRDFLVIGLGLPGIIWKTKEPIIWENIDSHPSFIRSKAARESGLRTAIGVPLITGDDFLGCFLLFTDMDKTVLEDHSFLFDGLGTDLGGILKQKILEDEYREFFEISPDPFCILGFDGTIKQANKALATILGVSMEMLVGQHYQTFIHEDDRPKLAKKFQNGVSDDIDYGNEVRMVTTTEEERWFVWSSTINRGEKLVLAVAKDITEQKRAELSLQRANERLQQAQRIAKLGYWRRDLSSDISEWSRETYAIHGYTPDEFIPTMANLIDTFHPEDRYLLIDDPKDHLEPGKVMRFEHRIITAHGETRWVQQEIQLMVDDANNPTHLEGTIQDITARKEYELQLKMSNDRFLLAMLASNQTIWEVDHTNKVLTYSHMTEDNQEQLAKEEFLKESSWFKRVHPDDKDLVWTALVQHLDTKNGRRGSLDYRTVGSDGTIGYVTDTFHTQRDSEGRPIRTIGSVMDVTVVKNQLEQIKLQNKALAEIAWLQSHAIRSPLTRIMALLKLYQTKGESAISNAELLRLISDSVTEIDSEIHKIIAITHNNHDHGNSID